MAMSDHPQDTAEEYPAIPMILDREQPLWQAGFTAWLLEAHVLLRQSQAPEPHHWLCFCLRQN